MKAIGSSLPTLYHGEDISGGEGGGMMVVPVGLPSLLFADVLAAIVASLLVSPLVAVIDKAIIQYSAGVTSTLLSPICSGTSDMLRNPGKFILKPEFLTCAPRRRRAHRSRATPPARPRPALT